MALSHSSAEIDLDAPVSSQALAVLSVAPESVVLDVGAADESVARRLVERGCRVVAVGAKQSAAQALEQFCEHVVAGDVGPIELPAVVDGLMFDAVLLLDVLSRVPDPLATLKVAAERLAPGGRLIVSVRNATHAALRLRVLGGRFPRAGEGPLGEQLHFFDRESLERLFNASKLMVIERLRTTAEIDEVDADIDPTAFPEEAVAVARDGEDADTFELVYVASAAQVGTETMSLGEALQRRIRDLERLHAQAVQHSSSLERRLSDLDRLTQREADAQARAEWLEDELRRRMEELERSSDDLRHAKLDIAIKEEQLTQLDAELAPLRARLDQLETALGTARTRIAERLKAASRRTPRLRRRLKRIADWIGDRRG